MLQPTTIWNFPHVPVLERLVHVSIELDQIAVAGVGHLILRLYARYVVLSVGVQDPQATDVLRAREEEESEGPEKRRTEAAMLPECYHAQQMSLKGTLQSNKLNSLVLAAARSPQGTTTLMQLGGLNKGNVYWEHSTGVRNGDVHT